MVQSVLTNFLFSFLLILQNTELDILNTLKWDLSAVTPQDFLPLILHKLPVTQKQAHHLHRCAQTFVALCAFGNFTFRSLFYNKLVKIIYDKIYH